MGTVALEGTNGDLEFYAVRSMIQERKNLNPLLAEVNILGKLTSLKAKKIGSPTDQDDVNIVALTDGSAYKYSIADLLADVKDIFDDTFSEDVYAHFNMKRRENEHFSKYLQYSRGEGYDPYEEYKYPAYAMMPEFGDSLNVEYSYQGEGYTSESGLKLFPKYSVDTARDFIMSELGIDSGKTELARDLNEFYTFMATAKDLFETLFHRFNDFQ